ncbi:MAG: SMC family ATPase [Candidatus Daviesbacteria bacterium]|nr:SMC family ATPase [Candidatus Daviesbacteria bacterium]
MIPAKLKLSNFTSYGENPPELDFTKFKLAAISGLNGAGKSSLLDSITWCLWGTSRAGDSSDDLIHLGAQEMNVEFSFELDGHLYAVKRKRIKKGGGQTALEFWSNSHNLTEGTIKATQQKITDTIHLTFETFTNSAYLRQGHADEFTTKGPTDRKRILADILGLDHYDKLEEKAKEKSKETQTKLTLLDYQLLEIETELSQKEEREKTLSLTEAEAKKVEAEIKEIESLIKIISERQEKINLQVKSLEEKRKQIETVREELSDLKLKMDLNKKAQEEFQSILEQKDIIEENYQKLLKLQETKKQLDETRSQLIKIKDELVDIQKILSERENKRKEAISKVELQVKQLQTRNETLESQNEDLKNKKDVCPTCSQPINGAKNKAIVDNNLKVIEKNKAEIEEFKKTIEKYQQIILPEVKLAGQKEKEIKELEEQTKSYFEVTEALQKLEPTTEKFTKLQQAITGVKTHQTTLLDLQKIYQVREEQIAKDESEMEKLKILEEDLQKIRLELAAEEQTKRELSQRALELSGKVGEARQLVSRAEQLSKLNETKLAEKNKLTEAKQIFDELALAFGKKGIQAMIIENAIPEIEDESNRLLEKLTEGRMKIRLETQKETKTKVLISEGEKGFATVETLEIVISDEMGERPYELYSGGETFRVNFAIRLAISKLLTHRAGAKLQFLVIDEGFGTQDAPGRARLVEVLDTIKDDFEKIIVITHIEELKEEFPVRIEVSKNSTGSTFAVVGV